MFGVSVRQQSDEAEGDTGQKMTSRLSVHISCRCCRPEWELKVSGCISEESLWSWRTSEGRTLCCCSLRLKRLFFHQSAVMTGWPSSVWCNGQRSIKKRLHPSGSLIWPSLKSPAAPPLSEGPYLHQETVRGRAGRYGNTAWHENNISWYHDIYHYNDIYHDIMQITIFVKYEHSSA